MIKNKRVAIVAPNWGKRGLITYNLGWIEWGRRTGVQIDIICDTGNIHKFYEPYLEEVNFIWEDIPDQPTGYREQDIVLHRQVVRMEDSIRLRNSIIKALSNHVYDAIIVNTAQALRPILDLGLDMYHDNIYYVTHGMGDIGIKDEFKIPSRAVKGMIAISETKILTQSWYTATTFKDWTGYEDNRVVTLAPFIGEPELWQGNDIPFEERSGILYIGPYESRKDPEQFIRACAELKVPARVISPSPHSARKFAKRFEEENVEYTIDVGLTGQAKVDAMKKARVAIIPSKHETFCYTAYEAAHLMPTFIPRSQDWAQAHRHWCYLTDNYVYDIRRVYDEPYKSIQLQKLLEFQKKQDEYGLEVIQYPESSMRQNALTKWVAKKKKTTVAEFVASRPSRAVDELCYMFKMANHPDYKVTHSVDKTWISLKET